MSRSTARWVVCIIVVVLVYFGLWNLWTPVDEFAVPTVLVIAVVSGMVGALAAILFNRGV